MSNTTTDKMDTIYGDHSVNELEFALGQVPGVENVYIHGSSAAVAVNTNTVLWELGGLISASNIFPATAVTCVVSSSSASDIGTTIKCTVLDSTYTRQTVTITLNGQTEVPIPIPITRVLYAESTNAQLVGNVYFGNGTATAGVQPLANTMAYIKAEDNATHQGAYTVPLGYSLLIKKFYGATSKNDEIVVNGARSLFGTSHFIKGTDIFLNYNNSQIDIGYYLVPEKTDIVLLAKSSTNTATAHSGIIGILVSNTYLTN